MDTSYLNNIKIDPDGDLPLFAQVRDALRALIFSKFTVGDPFYSERVLIEALPVSQITVRRALADLTQEGLISRKIGVGSVIANQAAISHVRRPVSAGPGEALAVPQYAAAAVAPSQCRSIGVIVDQCESDYGGLIVEHVSRIADERGLDIRFYFVSDSQRVVRLYRKIIAAPDVEAFIIFAIEEQSLLLQDALSGRGFRAVAVWSSDDLPGRAIVDTDAAEAAHIGWNYLRELGHERIVLLVNEPADRHSVRLKIDVFEDEIRRANLDGLSKVHICDVEASHNSYIAAYSEMDALWADPAQRPTAIMTVSDPGAWAAMKWLSEHSIAVPDEVSILGFEDAPASKYMHPALSTVAHQPAKIAQIAIDMLIETPYTPSVQLVKPLLVVRKSTGPAPKTYSAPSVATEALSG
ncbi:MAG: substrate-binding domain-containing protein [Capsulimonadaceae bacterium]|nr:substrate-binding domain-containing protein [Capsulimonadaceae bacterium]